MRRLSDEAERHFLRMMLAVDDYGCLECTPEDTADVLYPAMPHKDAEAVARMNDELEAAGLIRRWTDGDREYAVFVNFNRHSGACFTDDGKRTRNRRKTPEPPDAKASQSEPDGANVRQPRNSNKVNKAEPDGASRSQMEPVGAKARPVGGGVGGSVSSSNQPSSQSEVPTRAGPPPMGTTTVFDVGPALEAVTKRLPFGDGPDELNDREQVVFWRVVRDIAPKQNRHRVALLNALTDYGGLMIARALKKYEELPEKPRAPHKYFLAMVKNEGGKAARDLDKYDQKEEQRELRRRAETAPNTTSPHTGGHPGTNTIGDVLPNLPALRGTPDR